MVRSRWLICGCNVHTSFEVQPAFILIVVLLQWLLEYVAKKVASQKLKRCAFRIVNCALKTGAAESAICV